MWGYLVHLQNSLIRAIGNIIQQDTRQPCLFSSCTNFAFMYVFKFWEVPCVDASVFVISTALCWKVKPVRITLFPDLFSDMILAKGYFSPAFYFFAINPTNQLTNAVVQHKQL